MTGIENLIRDAWQWRREHKMAGRQIEAMAAGVRLHALLDAHCALGGDASQWRKPTGLLRD